MVKIFSYAADYPLQFIICILLASIPTIVWIWIFNQKYRERPMAIIIAFILGIFSAVIVLGYQYCWGKEFNMGFFYINPVNFQENIYSNIAHPLYATAWVFLSVGLLEEYAKHWVIKGMDKRYFRSVDDVIEISIIAALGFAFLENIGYFFQMIIRVSEGQIGVNNFVGLFFMRSIFVVFIHILCSGIYGYFYGVGYFSKGVYDDESAQGKIFWIPEIFHRLFHFKSERVFHDEMISLGLIVSTTLHGFYNFILDVNWSVGQMLGLPFLNNLMMHKIVLPVYLVFGFYYLNKLIEKKEDRKVFGKKIIMIDYDQSDENEDLNNLYQKTT